MRTVAHFAAFVLAAMAALTFRSEIPSMQHLGWGDLGFAVVLLLLTAVRKPQNPPGPST